MVKVTITFNDSTIVSAEGSYMIIKDGVLKVAGGSVNYFYPLTSIKKYDEITIN